MQDITIHIHLKKMVLFITQMTINLFLIDFLSVVN